MENHTQPPVESAFQERFHHQETKTEKAQSIMKLDFIGPQLPASKTRSVCMDLQQVMFVPILTIPVSCQPIIDPEDPALPLQVASNLLLPPAGSIDKSTVKVVAQLDSRAAYTANLRKSVHRLSRQFGLFINSSHLALHRTLKIYPTKSVSSSNCCQETWKDLKLIVTDSKEYECFTSILVKNIAASAHKQFRKHAEQAFCKTIADECQPFLQRFQTSKPMTPYLFEAVEKLLRYLMNRCVKPDLMKCTGPKLLSIDTKKSENLILSKNIDIGFATKRLLGETAITVTERQKLEFIHECRSMLTTMIAKLQEKSPLKQKAVRGLSSLDPCVIQHSPQLAQKRFSFLLEELNHANIINDVLAENAKKEYLHFCNLKKSELQEIFRPCDQFSDEVGLDTIYGSFLIGEANYKHLWEVIKICLVLSHGNATVEGGFSVNKSLLVENMHEKTVIAQRHIHDEIQEAGGIKNIHISKKMLDYVRGARKRYHEYLEMKKQEKSEKDKKKAEKRKLDIQVKDLEGERKKLMMATEEKREAIDVELQELKKKQASLY
uniref:Uncharacterized protein n=1 Tax=Timema monikensis TaxID=170555 RepID=A0A7R9HM48_9NEOP|nr:unnamed protein product [Timema monikensis]